MNPGPLNERSVTAVGTLSTAAEIGRKPYVSGLGGVTSTGGAFLNRSALVCRRRMQHRRSGRYPGERERCHLH